MNENLEQYIATQRSAGYSDDAIRQALLASGWNPLDIQVALQPAAASSIPGKRHSKRRLGIILVVVSVLVLLSGGAAGAYFFYWQSPAQVMQRSWEKMQTVQALNYTSTLNLEPTVPTESAGLNITLNGAVDKIDPSQIKTHHTIHIQPANEEFGAEVMSVGDVLYAQLTAAPTGGFLDLSKFTNQWVTLNRQELKDSLLTYLPADLRNAKITEQLEKDQLDLQKTEELRRIIQDTQVIQNITKLPTETINGQAMHHYRLQLNWTAIEEALLKMEMVLEGEVSNHASQKNYELLEQLSKTEPEIWLGKQDELLHRITVNEIFEYKGKEGNLQFQIDFSQYNQAVNITVPDASVSLNELILSFFSGLYKPKVVADTDQDGLSDSAEKIYQTDINLADTDGDGYMDGAEVDNGYDPLGPGKLGE